MQGDKLKNPLLNDDSFEQPEDNMLFQEEKKNLSFKSILKRMEMKKNLKKKVMTNRAQLKSKIISTVSAKEKNNQKFSYKMNVNSKVLKYNLVAEKSNNKFFSLIFNKLSKEKENIYDKLGINQPSKNTLKSMTNLRLHMGLNTNTDHFTNIGQSIKPGNDDKSSAIVRKVKSTVVSVDKNDKQEDIDIFITYKHLKKQGSNSSKNGSIDMRHQGNNYFVLDYNISHHSEQDGDLSKISEFGKDDAELENSEINDDDKSEGSYTSSLSNSVLKEFKEKKRSIFIEKNDLLAIKKHNIKGTVLFNHRQ